MVISGSLCISHYRGSGCDTDSEQSTAVLKESAEEKPTELDTTTKVQLCLHFTESEVHGDHILVLADDLALFKIHKTKPKTYPDSIGENLNRRCWDQSLGSTDQLVMGHNLSSNI